MVGLAYFGFLPLPEVTSVEWTSAAILMAIYGGLIVFTGVIFISGKADKLYEFEPHTKAIMSRRGELQVGACLLGFGVGIWGATIARGAQDMCILYLPSVLISGVYHYNQGGTKNAMVNLFFMMRA